MRFLMWSLLLASETCAADLRLFEAVEPHMGTLVRIQLYTTDQRRATAAFRAAFDRMHQLDLILSDYLPESELNRVSRNANGHAEPVSEDLFRVLAVSQELAEASGGAFDVTVGPLTHLWRQARRDGRFPDPDRLDEALSHCGYRKLHLSKAGRTVLLDQDGMQLDVGGIAKGYAAAEAIAVLKRMKISSALVAASGDLAFSDAPPGKRGWKIEIGATGGVMELANAAVSTSGDTEQHLDANGRRYSHIIDPITGYGLTNSVLVTVIAPDGAFADALATAVSVLGEARGKELVSRYKGSTVFVSQAKRG